MREIHACELLIESFNYLSMLKNNFWERLIAENKGVGKENDHFDLHLHGSAIVHAPFSTEIDKLPFVKTKIARKLKLFR
jgi:hypothetical protein